MQWMMLQQEQADDFVIATGKQISVRDFVLMSAKEAGISLEFTGSDLNEIATVISVDKSKAPNVNIGDIIVRVCPKYFRPAEVETLLGNPEKARIKLGWVPEITVNELCTEMVRCDLEKAKQLSLLRDHGFNISISVEDSSSFSKDVDNLLIHTHESKGGK